jgi:hypothetical protein
MSPNPGEGHVPAVAGALPIASPHSRQWMKKWRNLICLIVMLSTFTGCADLIGYSGPRPIDQLFIKYRDRVWARRAYNCQFRDQPRAYSEDFERGYVDGFCSVCGGGDGYIPAMPPKDYWAYQFQSPEGAECVNAYFEGYPLGAAAAKKRDLDKYHDVYISKMVDSAIKQTKAPVNLPGEVAIVSPQDADENPNPATSEAQDRLIDAIDASMSQEYNDLFQDQ